MTSTLSTGLDWVGLASSFLLVLGLLALLLFALKRMQGFSAGAGGQRQIQHLETLTAGTRQKIVLLRVKDREILLGVSATQITALAEWSESTAAGPTARPVYTAASLRSGSGSSTAPTASTTGSPASPASSASPAQPTSATDRIADPLSAQAPRFAADPRTGSAPSGALSFAAVLEHARMPPSLVHFFKRKA
ncbi:MAG: Flagellar protein FliO [Pseudomonadota bacterium]|jgi:flagellar protein FliO/FliZ